MVAFVCTGIFILFDILTGVLKALYKEGLNSTYLRQGLFHKLSEILAIALSALLEYGADYIDLGVELPFMNVVTVYICTMEFVSIVENLCEVNPTLAKLFRPYLEKLKKEE